ncbi:AN1-type zinc finger protein, partial [Acrasis kona]
MTEFYNIGKHCDHTSCHQKDFLPFTCELCKKTLCLDHRDFADHDCIKIEQQLAESTIPVCPVCDKPVSKRFPTEDNNLVISRHWESGQCNKKKQKLNKPRCNQAGCTQHKLLIECKSCQHSYCLTHRLQEDHVCNKTEKQPSIVTTLRSLHREKQIKKLYSEFKVEPVRSKKSFIKRRKPSEIVEFANTWNTSFMPGPDKMNMDDSNKIFVSVYYPLDSKIQPIRMYLDSRWSVGKAMDTIADFVNISNNNNKLPEDSEQRLNLYVLDTKDIHPLTNSVTLSELVSNQILRSKETTLVLERGLSGRSRTLGSEFLVKDVMSRCGTKSFVGMAMNKLI